jgi:hypothetical protein
LPINSTLRGSSLKQPELPQPADSDQVEEGAGAASEGEVEPTLKTLPEANEFSPGQIEVRTLLGLVAESAGNRAAIIDSVRLEFFAEAAQAQPDPEKRLQNQRTRAYNAVLGASKYGLVTDDLEALTALGDELLNTDDDETMYRLLARHIIRELNGLDVLLALREMQQAGDPINKTTLQHFLETRSGFVELPRATLHHTKLLQFLRKAHVLPERGYEVDVAAVEEIADVSLETADAWSALTDEQRAFVRVLRKLSLSQGSEPMPAKDVVDAATFEYGPIFKKPDQLASSVFKPLAEAGWITHSGTGAGRGGKSGVVAATEALLDTDVDLLPAGDDWGIPVDLRTKLQQASLEQIEEDLGSDDTHVKGIALELLAVRLALDLTLTPTRLRERGVKTGGAEVDLIAEAAHLHFSRWLLQCKNTKKVHVSALAKEVGMAVLLKAQVVVVVTTGTFTPAVESYARELGATTALQVVLVDETVLDAYRTGGASALRKYFNDRARDTLALKRPQVVSEVDL